MILNILALVATLAVAYMGAVQGVYRSAKTLVACVVAGAVAFGFFGPMAGWFPADNPRSVWYFAADALCLWALFCVVFLALRTLGEMLWKAESDFSAWADRIGGGALGAVSGYLTVGVCTVLVQMLPTAPDFLGYEAFTYVRPPSVGQPGSVKPGDRLWLGWDRGTLAFFGYLSSGALGSKENSVFQRYGDVYPPKEMRGEKYAGGEADLDDFLYYHWYRRWEFILWQTGEVKGPVSRTAAPSEGLPLVVGKSMDINDVNIRIIRVDRTAALEDFPSERLASREEFLVLTLRFRPLARWPHGIDSAQFVLEESPGVRVKRTPLVYGRARAAKPQNEVLTEGAIPCEVTPRGLRFGIPPDKPQGHFLMDGAAFRFTEGRQCELRTFVFVIPKGLVTDEMRVTLAPKPPATVKPPEAKPGPAAPAAKPPEARPTDVKPPAGTAAPRPAFN